MYTLCAIEFFVQFIDLSCFNIILVLPYKCEHCLLSFTLYIVLFIFDVMFLTITITMFKLLLFLLESTYFKVWSMKDPTITKVKKLAY